MNLKKGKFKIVEGTRVRMVSSKDTHIVEGAYGTVVSPGIRESEVRWDSMLAIRADYRYRNELKDALIIPVYNDLLDPSETSRFGLLNLLREYTLTIVSSI